MRQGILLAVLVIGFSLSGPNAASAEEWRRLSGAEIRGTLAGNTVAGTKQGRAWRQHFAANGTTVWSAEGKGEYSGRWRIKGNEYCSKFSSLFGENCFTVFGKSRTRPPRIKWIGKGGEWPAQVLSGNRM